MAYRMQPKDRDRYIREGRLHQVMARIKELRDKAKAENLPYEFVSRSIEIEFPEKQSVQHQVAQIMRPEIVTPPAPVVAAAPPAPAIELKKRLAFQEGWKLEQWLTAGGLETLPDTVDERQMFKWVFMAMDFSDKRVVETAPSAGAVSYLVRLRKSITMSDDFYKSVMPKLLPTKSQMEKEEALNDDARPILSTIEKLLAELGKVAVLQPVSEGARGESDISQTPY